MEKKNEGWLNLENGAFIGSMLLLGWAVISYVHSTPAPIVLEPAHYEESEVLKPREKKNFDPESYFAGKDPLVPQKLSEVVAFTLRSRPPKTLDPTKWKLPDFSKYLKKPTKGDTLVNLPTKKTVKPEAGKPVEKPKEPPFPLRLIGILKPDGSSKRIAIVATPAGKYQHLHAGDEWRVEGESIKVVSVAPTWVIFERENGKKIRLSNDPMTSWKSTGSTTNTTTAQTPAASAKSKPVNIPPDVKKMLEAAGVKIPPNLTQKDVDALMKKMPKGMKSMDALKSLMGKNMPKGFSPEQLQKLLKGSKGADPGMMDKLKNFF